MAQLEGVFTEPYEERLYANWSALFTRLKIYEKNSAAARLWLEAHKNQIPSPRFYQIEEHLTTLYALLMTLEYEKAEALSESLIILCKRYNRIRYTAELYLLKTICMEKKAKKNDLTYLNPLYKAVLIGQKYKFIWLFTIMEQNDLRLSLLQKNASACSYTGINETFLKSLIAAAKRAACQVDTMANEVHYIKLSKKQREVLLYLSRSFSYEQIGNAMDLKVTTIRTHVSNLYRKLDATNKKEALFKASELGFFDQSN